MLHRKLGNIVAEWAIPLWLADL